MKKFTFKLESVLKYRKHLENLAQEEVVKAHINVINSEKKLKYLKQESLKSTQELDKSTLKGITATLFRQYNDYIDSVQGDIVAKIKELQTLKQIFAQKHKELTQKSVDRKIIERLKEKKRLEYMDEVLTEEQIIADEVASLKKAREGVNGAI